MAEKINRIVADRLFTAFEPALQKIIEAIFGAPTTADNRIEAMVLLSCTCVSQLGGAMAGQDGVGGDTLDENAVYLTFIDKALAAIRAEIVADLEREKIAEFPEVRGNA